MYLQHNPDWRMLGHNLNFGKIMMMVGLNSLESLHRCRQVCRTWNDMIMQNIWESPSKRNIIKMRVESVWAAFCTEVISCKGSGLPSVEELSHAKWLGNK